MIENRFKRLTPRQRYEQEYRECRMFTTYLDSKWDFEGDSARLNAYRSWQMRFATLPKMPRHSDYRYYEGMVEALLFKWPNARNLQYTECHCSHEELMISFQLPSSIKLGSNLPNHEQCGFWCSGCDWSNAGARPVEVNHDRKK